MPTPINRLGLLPEVNRQLAAIGVDTVEAFSDKINDGFDFIKYIGFEADEMLDLIEEVNEIAPIKRGVLVHHLSPEEQKSVNEIDVEGTARVTTEIQNVIRRMTPAEREKLASQMVQPIRGAPGEPPTARATKRGARRKG